MGFIVHVVLWLAFCNHVVLLGESLPQVCCAPTRLSGCARNARAFLRIVFVASNLKYIFLLYKGQSYVLLAIKWWFEPLSDKTEFICL